MLATEASIAIMSIAIVVFELSFLPGYRSGQADTPLHFLSQSILVQAHQKLSAAGFNRSAHSAELLPPTLSGRELVVDLLGTAPRS